MSLNVKKLSHNKGRDIDRITCIILENKFDIVVIQEVLGVGKILTSVNSKIISGSLSKNMVIRWCNI